MDVFMDLVNQLVLEHKKDLSFYDIDNFIYAQSQMIGESVTQALLPDPTKYCQYIDKIIGYADRVTMTPEALADFYSKIYKSPLINEKNITIPVQAMEDIEKIRPEYLSSVPMEFDKVITQILKGTIKESEIRTKYVSGEYFNKLRKQIVKTSIPYNDVKDLMVNENPAVVSVTTTYIQSSIIPFLKSYNQNVKDLTVIAQNAKGRIINTCAEMNNSMNAISTLEASGKLDAKQLRMMTYFKYNMYRQYMNTCAYLVTLLIRKMKYYTFNIMSFINLYNTIYNYFPEGEYVLHEYVEGNEISDLDDSTLLNSVLNNGLNVILPYVQSAINRKRIQLSNLIAKRHNIQLNYQDMENDNKYPYDTHPYAVINNSVISIVNDLHNFEVNSQDPNMIVDDVLAKSHLDIPFISQYSDTLVNTDSMDFYTAQGALIKDDDESVMMSLYSDLSAFEKNASSISNNIAKAYQYIEALVQKFEMNTNDLDDNTYNEYKSTLDDVMKNFKEYALYVTKKLLSRLENMIALMDDGTPDENPSDPTPEAPANYANLSYQEAYDEICDLEKIVFESVLKEYYAKRKAKETGVKVIFEETGEAPADNSNPSVKTDANTQHTQNNANDNKTTTTTQNTETKESVVEKFKKWLQDLLNKFKDKSARLTGTNSKWLASVKADILGLDTSNTTISLAKYEGVDGQTLNGNIQSALNKINGINASSLPADLKSKAKAETYIFSSIPSKVGNEDNFVARIKQFYTFGNTDKTTLVTYSGDDAKTKIANIIEFCEGYENTYKTVSSALDKLGQAASKKQQDIINALGTQAQATTTTSGNNNQAKPATESVIIEAQTQAVNVNGSATGDSKENKEKISASSMITSVTREYTGAILTVLEKKYLDYIKVLSKLAPKKENAPKQEENKGSEEGQEQK